MGDTRKFSGIVYSKTTLYSDLENAFPANFKGKKGVVFTLKDQGNSHVDIKNFKIYPVWFKNDSWVDCDDTGQCEGVPLKTKAARAIYLNGESETTFDVNESRWEFSEVEPFKGFEFAFFYYDAIKLILENTQCDEILITGAKANFGRNVGNISCSSGEYFTMQIEEYTKPKGEKFVGTDHVKKLGLPMFALGLSCPINWFQRRSDCAAEAGRLFQSEMRILLGIPEVEMIEGEEDCP